MTATGLLLIPLGVLLLFASWRVILIALPSFALLQGAAVVNVGSVGLQPGYFFALLIIGRTLLEIGLLRQPLNRSVLLQMLPLGLFIVISVVTLWAAVTFFHGQILVIGGTDGLQLERARPYQFRRENITQIAYIIINTTLVYAVAHQIARMTSQKILETVDKSMIVALSLASLVCVWQLAAYYLGFQFPSTFFLSNVGYAQTHGDVLRQQFFGYLRLNGPFSEPSALAYFFCAFLFYVWKRYRLQSSLLSAGLVISTSALIFLAYSTTGYAILTAFVVIAAVDLLANLIRRTTRRAKSGYHRIAIAFLIVAAVAAIAVVLYQHRSGLGRIFQQAIADKAETTSFQSRVGADRMAIDVFVKTRGLGLGLGSHKPNSMLLTLVSNVGIIGTLVFAVFVAHLLRPPSEEPVIINDCLLTSGPLRFFIFGLLFAHGLSNPNLNEILMWIGFGLMLGYLANKQYEMRTAGAPIAGIWAAGIQPQALDLGLGRGYAAGGTREGGYRVDHHR